MSGIIAIWLDGNILRHMPNVRGETTLTGTALYQAVGLCAWPKLRFTHCPLSLDTKLRLFGFYSPTAHL